MVAVSTVICWRRNNKLSSVTDKACADCQMLAHQVMYAQTTHIGWKRSEMRKSIGPLTMAFLF